MDKITIERCKEGWKSYPDDDDTISGVGESPYKALDALATAIKFFN